MSERRRPNLIVAGVNKAGTTSLFAYLSQHPAVSPSRIKETCYFLPLRYGEPLPPLDVYLAAFDPRAGEPWLMEATPGYFYGGAPLAAAIDATCPGARIVVVLREPVERLRSFVAFQKSRLLLDRDLALGDYLDRCLALDDAALARRENNTWFGVAGGQYARWLPAWTGRFGDRLFLLTFDELRAAPRTTIERICRWLTIDPAPCRTIELTTENRTTGYRNPTLQALALRTNDAFERFFRAHPRLKGAARGLYYRLNASRIPTPGADDPAIVSKLRAIYAPSNRETARILREHGATLPAWLEVPAPATSPGGGPAARTG